jgi:hypothetical protein
VSPLDSSMAIFHPTGKRGGPTELPAGEYPGGGHTEGGEEVLTQDKVFWSGFGPTNRRRSLTLPHPTPWKLARKTSHSSASCHVPHTLGQREASIIQLTVLTVGLGFRVPSSGSGHPLSLSRPQDFIWHVRQEIQPRRQQPLPGSVLLKDVLFQGPQLHTSAP